MLREDETAEDITAHERDARDYNDKKEDLELKDKKEQR